MFYGFPSSLKGEVAMGTVDTVSGSTIEAVLAAVGTDKDNTGYPAIVVFNSLTWETAVHVR